ncbi:hypothetical protein [Pseudomonas sp. T1.Ur]|uniref:hypothetical protein n=1 Tax=Pseudomonas sp. T1.Ur TaxID=2928704 RepID=UPI00201E543D|nr:hypothetical protein [Pseudomonas sp. T1.Ur]MCL6701122.1 hypothetical protein [Pseudomonas sp. T1.Ur]
MTNKTITLSRELVERAVMRPGKESLAVNNADIIARGRAQAEIRELLADPVPPAGGDGFDLALKVREALDRKACPDAWMRIAVETSRPLFDELIGNVTRLQAEVERLSKDFSSWKEAAAGIRKAQSEEVTKAVGRTVDLQGQCADLQSELTSANADKEAYAQNAIDLRAEVERLKSTCQGFVNLHAQKQAELTKARELLVKGGSLIERMAQTIGATDESGDFEDEIEAAEELAGEMIVVGEQSAPADKGRGQPVAWRFRVSDSSDWFATTKASVAEMFHNSSDGGQAQPLYAEQPAPVAVVKP